MFGFKWFVSGVYVVLIHGSFMFSMFFFNSLWRVLSSLGVLSSWWLSYHLLWLSTGFGGFS